MKPFLMWSWGTTAASCWFLMLLKGPIFRANALIYIKEPYVLFFWIAGLLSHHQALFPRYLYRVLKNSVAPSPTMQARHLDRMAPSTRSQWIKEWRSLRGGVHVKCSDLSTPPSPNLESPVDFYHHSPISTSDDVALNVISENYLRPRQSWTTEPYLQHEGLFILEFVNTMVFFFFHWMGGILHKSKRSTFPHWVVTNHLLGWRVHYAIQFLTNVCRACPPCSPHNMVPYWTHKPVTFLMGFQCTVLTQLVIPPTPPKRGTFPEQNIFLSPRHLRACCAVCAINELRMTGWPLD